MFYVAQSHKFRKNVLFLKIVFYLDHFLKSLYWHLLQYCFCFMFWFFGHEACGILVPRPGIEPAPSASEGEVLTTEPLRESPGTHYLIAYLCLFSSAFSAGIIGLEPTVCRAQYWIPWEVGVRKKKDTAFFWVAFIVQWQYSKALSKAEMWMRAGERWDCQSTFRDGHVKERKSVWGGGPGSQVDLPHSDSSCFLGLGTPTESPCKE